MKRAFILILAIMLLLAIPAAAQAAPGLDREIGAGETITEDVVTLGGTLLVEEGATIEGSVTVLGGNAELNGRVTEGVAIFGGNTTLAGTVEGDLVIVGGQLAAAESAAVNGECLIAGGTIDGENRLNCTTMGSPAGLSIPAVVRPRFERMATVEPAGTLGRLGSVAGESLLLGLLALLAASLLPNQLKQVSTTLLQRPAASGAVGLLTAVAGPSLLVLLLLVSTVLLLVCIGLLGFPIAIVLGAALLAGVVMGWIAVGTAVGEKLAQVLRLSNRSLAVTAALGTVALTLATGLLGSLPFLFGGWLWSMAAILIASAGLGAVTLTRFGTRPYPLAIEPGGKMDIIIDPPPAEKYR